MKLIDTWRNFHKDSGAYRVS